VNELTQSDVYETEVRIEARPETIFGFFTDPAKMVQWKGVDAALEPRPGGIYRVNVTGHETAIGEYLEVVPFRRIVFTWGWDSGPVRPGSTRVEVDLIPDGNATIVRLRHFGLDAEGLTSHKMGWEHFLPRLVLAAQGQDAGTDPWTLGEPQ
jgi:uncharacterized protein YndB with AHSA1/START domain